MYGLEAINQNNGWAIAVVGITIVFSGLVSLSIVISQLHKILGLLENPGKIKEIFARKSSEGKEQQKSDIPEGIKISAGQKEILKQFALLVRTLEDHFSLPRLLRLAVISDVKEPYVNLDLLLKCNIIRPDGNGFFIWDSQLLDRALKQ